MKEYMAIVDGTETEKIKYHGWKVGNKVKLDREGPVLRVTKIDHDNETISFDLV